MSFMNQQIPLPQVNTNWYQFDVPFDEKTGALMENIQKEFDTLTSNLNVESELVALFGSGISPENHEDSFITTGKYSFYFTPDSVKHVTSLILKYGAKAIPIPKGTQLALLVGDRRAWSLLNG